MAHVLHTSTSRRSLRPGAIHRSLPPTSSSLHPLCGLESRQRPTPATSAAVQLRHQDAEPFMAAGRENRDGRRGRRDRGGGGLTEVEADQPGAEASGGGLDGVEADRSAQRQINPAQRWIGPAWRQSSWPSPSPNPRHREEAHEGGAWPTWWRGGARA
jgi:hypothetical protein